jgi:phospholipase C
MRLFRIRHTALILPFMLATIGPKPAFADGNIQKANHIIVLMQENHSFDNYFGALAYAPGSPYQMGTELVRRPTPPVSTA